MKLAVFVVLEIRQNRYEEISSVTSAVVSPPSSLEETGSSRRVRLARLCALLQDKYKHLCRQERAATRQKRHRYAFRKALLHAAAKDPDCTAELIQALCKISRSSSR